MCLEENKEVFMGKKRIVYVLNKEHYYVDKNGSVRRKNPKIRGISKKRRKQITKMAKAVYQQGQRQNYKGE